jgi:hypothetical protein
MMNLFSGFIILTLYFELKGKKRKARRLLPWVCGAIFAISLAIAIVPYEHYKFCPSDEYRLYCGNCPSSDNGLWASLI